MQTELSATRARLDAKRRERRLAGYAPATSTPDFDLSGSADESRPEDKLSAVAKQQRTTPARQRFGLVQATEALFSRSPLNLPASVFAGAVARQFTS